MGNNTSKVTKINMVHFSKMVVKELAVKVAGVGGNPNGPNVNLAGTKLPTPPAPKSEAKPSEGSARALDDAASGMMEHANAVWKQAPKLKYGDKPDYHVEQEKIDGITEIYNNG